MSDKLEMARGTCAIVVSLKALEYNAETHKPGAYDGFPCHATLAIGPYSVLIFSQ
jgi:hypothetical protein